MMCLNFPKGPMSASKIFENEGPMSESPGRPCRRVTPSRRGTWSGADRSSSCSPSSGRRRVAVAESQERPFQGSGRGPETGRTGRSRRGGGRPAVDEQVRDRAPASEVERARSDLRRPAEVLQGRHPLLEDVGARSVSLFSKRRLNESTPRFFVRNARERISRVGGAGRRAAPSPRIELGRSSRGSK